MKILPKKSLGQNFLINKEIIKKIVEEGQINHESFVLEIGPGTGNLTEEILKNNPKKFLAIEKDKNLYLALKKKFKSNLELINQDVLKIEWEKIIGNNFVVFGNLPYNISSQILVNWIRLNKLNKIFRRFILMFQKEVADRINADLNSNKYGRLAILTSLKLSSKKIMDIEPENFFPKPKVKSSVLCFEPNNTLYNFKDIKSLEKVTDIFFQNKRKMIKKPINILFKNPSRLIQKLRLNEKCRPQNLDALTYFKISEEFENQ